MPTRYAGYLHLTIFSPESRPILLRSPPGPRQADSNGTASQIHHTVLRLTAPEIEAPNSHNKIELNCQ